MIDWPSWSVRYRVRPAVGWSVSVPLMLLCLCYTPFLILAVATRGRFLKEFDPYGR